MRMRTLLIPLVACAGCLARDISKKIDQIQCGGSGNDTGEASGSSGTTGCPDTDGETTAASGDTVAESTGTGSEGGTDSDSGDAGSGSSSVSPW